jgi:hypothetical protein
MDHLTKNLKERVLKSIKYTSTDTACVPSLWHYNLLFSYEIRGVTENISNTEG